MRSVPIIGFAVLVTGNICVLGRRSDLSWAPRSITNQRNLIKENSFLVARGGSDVPQDGSNDMNYMPGAGGGDIETQVQVETVLSPPEEEITPAAPVESTLAPPTPASEVAPVPAEAKAAPTSGLTSRLKNITERTGGALLVLVPGTLFAWKCGKPGLLALVFALQWGMYYETTKVIEDHYRLNSVMPERPLKRQFIQKWWWFVTIVLASSFRALVVTANPETSPNAFTTPWMQSISTKTVDFVAYAMTAIGLIKSVIGMAFISQAGPDIFRKHLAKMASCHFALLYLIGQSSFWILTIQEFGIPWIVYPSLLVIVNDTMAYIFGCLMGKTKLLPSLSPKKTVEGFLGAAVSTVAVSLPLLKYVVGTGQPGLLKHALALSTFCSLVAPFGGFLASAVKRAFNTKDFGTLIPGHGGVLDRFDCHLVSAPFVYLYLRQFWGVGSPSEP